MQQEASKQTKVEKKKKEKRTGTERNGVKKLNNRS